MSLAIFLSNFVDCISDVIRRRIESKVKYSPQINKFRWQLTLIGAHSFRSPSIESKFIRTAGGYENMQNERDCCQARLLYLSLADELQKVISGAFELRWFDSKSWKKHSTEFYS